MLGLSQAELLEGTSSHAKADARHGELMCERGEQGYMMTGTRIGSTTLRTIAHIHARHHITFASTAATKHS